MENLILTDQSQALVALGVVAMMFLLFLRESFLTEVVAIFGVAVLLISGVLPYDVALAVCPILLLGQLRPCFWLWGHWCVLAAVSDLPNWRIA